jgi:CMP-N,N'-diacetyllegionaminic acid synthase
MDIIAIIPARGGSKGIERKNLSLFNGAPLVVNSIRHALNSQLITRVVVTTDDEEIRAVALSAGAEAPFLRPKELAGDQVLDLPVFEHALNFLKLNEGFVPKLVVHLRPTAPYREVGWIDEAITMLMNDHSADSVRSVSVPDKHPYRMFSIESGGYLKAIMGHEHPIPYLLRRQDLPLVYYYNCVVDVTRPQTIFQKKSMTGEKILAYLMDSEKVIDIDTARDLEIAKFLFENKK